MTGEAPVTEIQTRYAAAARIRSVAFWLVVLMLAFGSIAVLVLGYLALGYLQSGGRHYLSDETHFKYGSIGAELSNGLPYKIFLALPKIFPEQFAPQGDYSRFGFIYEGKAAPEPELPIGFAKGNRQGVDVAWFNCAVCHTGKVTFKDKTEKIIVGMPANTVDLEALFLALFDMAVDKRFSWDDEAFRDAVGADDMWLIDRILWAWIVVPNTRATLIKRRSELLPLLDPSLAPRLKWKESRTQCPAQWTSPNADAKTYCRSETNYDLQPYPPYWPGAGHQPARWGPGRVDTFNPYKLINFNVPPECLEEKERTGVSDFPAIFMQRVRSDQGMHLHWDGNNASLDERNLSAAIGAGVTEDTADHASIERVAKWLHERKPDAVSPYKPGPGLDAGKKIYMQACARCHGWQNGADYIYEGDRLGQIEPWSFIGTDRGRLDSYTIRIEKYQKDQLFCREPDHRFRFFKKTDGYANMPLDFLWLRAPYLHNGSVPTLKDLLEPQDKRPKTFVRGLTELDVAKGGFRADACAPDAPLAQGFCYDTSLPGNRNTGHLYGTELSDAEKNDLLQYLLTF